MIRVQWMLLLSCFSLVACSSTESAVEPASKAAQNAVPATVTVVKAYTKDTDKSALICRKEKVLGSNRAVKVCKTIGQQDEDRKRAEGMVNDGSLRQSLGGG